MDIKFLDLKQNYQNIKEEIDTNIQTILNNNSYILGQAVDSFEQEFAKYINVQWCIGVANGTDALEIAIRALDIQPGDEIITQNNTFYSTCSAIINSGAILHIVDCNTDYTMNLDHLENMITNKTRLVIPVHLYGYCTDMDRLMKICKDKNILVLEDCAQAHGAVYKNKKLGTFGNLATFSFYPGKNLGAFGDAGAIVTNNKYLADKCKLQRNLGSIEKYNHEIIGRNSRLDSIQAAVLSAKLPHLDSWNNRRRQIACMYSEHLKSIGDIVLPVVNNDCIPVYHLYIIRTKYRNDLRQYLSKKGIETGIHYPIPINKQKAFADLNLATCAISEDFGDKLLSLPIYPELNSYQINYIIDAIKSFFMVKIIPLTEKCSKGGILLPIEDYELPFKVKRIFYIYNVENGTERGNHGHFILQEFLIALKGSCKITVYNSGKTVEYILDSPKNGLHIPPISWIQMSEFSNDCILAVHCSENYSLDDTIYDLKKFKEKCNEKC